MMNVPVAGLTHYYKAEISSEIVNYIESILSDWDVEIKRVAIIGSRMNENHREDSYIDVALEYRGEEREDDVFNALMEEPLTIEGLTVDFLPYSENKGGGIGDRPQYMLYDITSC